MLNDAIAWAEREIARIKADEHYRPEMTKHLEVLVAHASPPRSATITWPPGIFTSEGAPVLIEANVLFRGAGDDSCGI